MSERLETLQRLLFRHTGLNLFCCCTRRTHESILNVAHNVHLQYRNNNLVGLLYTVKLSLALHSIQSVYPIHKELINRYILYSDHQRMFRINP